MTSFNCDKAAAAAVTSIFLPHTSAATDSTAHTCAELLFLLKDKNLLNEEGIVKNCEGTKPLPLPPKSRERLLERLLTFIVVEKTINKSFPLKSLLDELKDDFDLVGSAAFHVAGADLLAACLEPFGIVLSQELLKELNEKIPFGNDVDLRSELSENQDARLAYPQGRLWKALGVLLLVKDIDKLNREVLKKPFTSLDGSIFQATLGTVNETDLVFYSKKQERTKISTLDELTLNIKTQSVKSRLSAVIQSYVDHLLLKKLRIDEPATLNLMAWTRIFCRRLQGFSLVDPEIEAAVLSRLILNGESFHDRPSDWLATRFQKVAKDHLPKEDNAFIRIVYLALPTLVKVLSEEKLTEFCTQVITLMPKDPYGLFCTKPKLLIEVLGILAPFHTLTFLPVSALDEAGITPFYDNPAALTVVLKRIPGHNFKNPEELLFRRLLLLPDPYTLWKKLLPHLSSAQKKQFREELNKLKEGITVESKQQLHAAVAASTSALLTPPENINLSYPPLAEKACKLVKEKPVQARLDVISTLEIGRAQADQLESHGAYAALIVAGLQLKGGLPKKDYLIDFKKIFQPELRLEVAFYCLTYNLPIKFDNLADTLPYLKTDAKTEKWLRTLVNKTEVTERLAAGIFAWLNSALESKKFNESLLWIPVLLSPPFASHLKRHTEFCLKFIHAHLKNSACSPQDMWKLCMLAEIKQENLLIPILKGLLARNDKASLEFVWKAFPYVKDENFWNKLFTKPSAHLLIALQDLDRFKAKNIRKTLLLSCLSLPLSDAQKQKHFSALAELNQDLHTAEWVIFLLKNSKLHEATLELKPIKVTRELITLWIEKLLSASVEAQLEVSTYPKEELKKLLNHPDITPTDKLKGYMACNFIKESFSLICQNPTAVEEPHTLIEIIGNIASRSVSELEELQLLLSRDSIKKLLKNSWAPLFEECISILIEDHKATSKSSTELFNHFNRRVQDLICFDLNTSKYESVVVLKLFSLLINAISQPYDFTSLLKVLHTLHLKLSLKHMPPAKRGIMERYLSEHENLFDVPYYRMSLPAEVLSKLMPFYRVECEILLSANSEGISHRDQLENLLLTRLNVMVDHYSAHEYLFMDILDKFIYLHIPENTPIWIGQQKDRSELFVKMLRQNMLLKNTPMALAWRLYLDPELYHLSSIFPSFPSFSIEESMGDLLLKIDSKLLPPLDYQHLLIEKLIYRYICHDTPMSIFRATLLLGNIQKFLYVPPSLRTSLYELDRIKNLWSTLILNSKEHLHGRLEGVSLHKALIYFLFREKLPFNCELHESDLKDIQYIVELYFEVLLNKMSDIFQDPIRVTLATLLDAIRISQCFADKPEVYYNFVEKLIPNGMWWFNINSQIHDTLTWFIEAPIAPVKVLENFLDRRIGLLKLWEPTKRKYYATYPPMQTLIPPANTSMIERSLIFNNREHHDSNDWSEGLANLSFNGETCSFVPVCDGDRMLASLLQQPRKNSSP